ncbi:MAG: phosphatase [Actinomycetota bacterium]|nr:phosphatase [Actinomycetota bacterium]
MRSNGEAEARQPLTEQELVQHLVTTRLSGRVATSVQNSIGNAHRLLAGDADYTFGLSDWRDATYDEVVMAVGKLGATWEAEDGADTPTHPALIDPQGTLDGITRHRDTLRTFLEGGGGRALVCTGHPYGLLAHYSVIADALARSGCELLRPLAGRRDVVRRPDGRPCQIGYPHGVGALAVGGGLHHTHRSHYMEAMLEEVGGAEGVDLVVADHGFAGTAIEAGIPTLSIADVNDPALPLAQARGRTDGVLLIDDGLEPMVFVPVTDAIVADIVRGR